MTVFAPPSIQPALTAQDLTNAADTLALDEMALLFDYEDDTREPVARAVHHERIRRARIALQLAAESAPKV